MPTYPLAYRITDFLKRQVAWSKMVLAELDTMEIAADDELEPLVRLQTERAREARNMALEYNGLSYEWERDTTVSDEARAEIRALSQQAQELTEALHQRYALAQQGTEACTLQTQDALDDLRRSRRSVTIYRSENLVSPEFIDRKA